MSKAAKYSASTIPPAAIRKSIQTWRRDQLSERSAPLTYNRFATAKGRKGSNRSGGKALSGKPLGVLDARVLAADMNLLVLVGRRPASATRPG
jgi:hypothetical protein